MARRTPALRPLDGAAVAVADQGSARLHPQTRVLSGTGCFRHDAGHGHAPPRQGGRQLFHLRGARRLRIHCGGRGGAGAVRRPGRRRDRTRACHPRRAPRARRSRGACRDLPGGRGRARRQHGPAVVQPRGEANRRASARARPRARGGAEGAHLPVRERHRDDDGQDSARRRPRQRGAHARRGGGVVGGGRA